MRVEFLLVLLFETEDHLAGDNTLLCALELQVRVERDLGRILVYVCLNSPLIDIILGDTVLVNPHSCQGIQCARVDVPTSIRDDTDDNLLPAVLAPGPGFAAAAEMGNVFHDGVHCSREANFVLVVHGDAYDKLRLSDCPTDILTQLVSSVDKVVRIAGDSCVSHVRELDLVPSGQEAVEDGGNLAF